MNMPSVSVILPTHNRLSFLQESVASVLNQTWTEFELIVCDDASTDGTSEYIASLVKNDNRVRPIVHKAHVGMAENWISGFNAAKGDYVALLTDDDRWAPQFLETCYREITEHVGCAMTFTNLEIIDEKGVIQKEETRKDDLRWSRNRLQAGRYEKTAWLELAVLYRSIPLNGALISNALLQTCGGLNVAASYSLDLFINAKVALAGVAQGFHCRWLPSRLLQYRVHQGSLTANHARRLEIAVGNQHAVELLLAEEWPQHLRIHLLKMLARSLTSQASALFDMRHLGEARSLSRRALKTHLNVHTVSYALYSHLPFDLRQSLRKMRRRWMGMS